MVTTTGCLLPTHVFPFYKFIHPTAKFVSMQICLSDRKTFFYPLKMPENGSFQNLLTPPTFHGNYSYYNSSIRETVNLNFIYKSLYVSIHGIFKTNKGNFNRSKRTKKLNFKEFLVDFWPKFLEAVTMVTEE